MLEDFTRYTYRYNTYTEMNDTLQVLDNLPEDKKYKEEIIDAHLGYQYQGNFIGLLLELNVPPKDHLLALYLNGLNNPYDYTGDNLIIKVPISPRIPK